MRTLRQKLRDKADTLFSLYVRTRDNFTCRRCLTQYPHNSMGYHCSHYYGRTIFATRWDETNCDGLCFGCHRIWEKEQREAYRDFKVGQLGQKGFDELKARSMIMHVQTSFIQDKIDWLKEKLEEYSLGKGIL